MLDMSPLDESCYDTTELALTQRGWWLSNLNGQWLLREPVLLPAEDPENTTGLAMVSYRDATAPDEILLRLGLAHLADLAKNVPSEWSLEQLLAQAGMLPFAHMTGNRRTFCIPLDHERPTLTGSTLLAAHAKELGVTIDTVRCDAQLAEKAKISEAVFTHGRLAATWLTFRVVEFKLACRSREGRENAISDFFQFLVDRGLNSPAHVSGIDPKLAAYLKCWRPEHLRTLLRVGAVSKPPCQLHILS